MESKNTEAKVTKVDKMELQHGQDAYPVFALTVDTGISATVGYDKASKATATELPFVYLPDDLSGWDAILAASEFATEDEIPKEETYDYRGQKGACEAGHFIFQHPDSFVVVGVLGISAPPGATTWYATVLAVNKTRGNEWKF